MMKSATMLTVLLTIPVLLACGTTPEIEFDSTDFTLVHPTSASEGGEFIAVSYRPDGSYVVNGDRGDAFHQVMGTEPGALPVARPPVQGASCYIACYSHSPDGVYPVGPKIYVHGLVQVAGAYIGSICRPTGDEHEDISAMGKFKALCAEETSTCAQGGCWAGGDTGGFFGHH